MIIVNVIIFSGYFKYYFTYVSFLFHCEIPMPYGVANAKITITYFHYLVKYRCTNSPCNLIVSNNGTQVYATVIIILLHVNHNAYFSK